MGGSRLIFGVDSEKGYQPYPIPPRETLAPRESRNTARAQKPTSTPVYLDAFAEISLTTQPTEPLSPVPQSESLTGRFDAIQTLFYDMRQIGQRSAWEDRDHTEVFYEQALFMKDFSDSYCGSAAFKRYHPSYQEMSYEQLRTYFTWRTNVRNGCIEETSVSYAFLYMFELLNNVGVDGPAQGLETLFEFWQAFRVFDPLIDRYVLPWLKDYHIYYPNLGIFREFALSHQLQDSYPSAFCCSSDQANSFDLFSPLSSYDITGSLYYSDTTEKRIRGCFSFILDRLRTLCVQKDTRFEELIFRISERKTRWVPFSKALFYPSFEQTERTVDISEMEQYTCENGIWSGNSILLTESGKQLLGYIMKAMEVQLRAIDRFRYKLTADLSSYKAIDVGIFQELGISLPHVIEESCTQFQRLITHRTVAVDLDNLSHIREELNTNQEKLLVPDAKGVGLSSAATATPTLVAAAPAATVTTASTPVSPLAQGAPLTQATAPEQPSGWAQFCASLQETDRGTLRIVLQNGDVNAYARDCGIMPEILIDSINEKTMDAIGDAILEFDGAASIFDEYLEDLRGAMENI